MSDALRAGLEVRRGAKITLVIVLFLLTSVLGFGLTQLRFDDDYKNLFSAETPEFQGLRQYLKRFPNDELELLLIIKGEQLLSADRLASVQGLLDRIEALEAIESVYSVFSIPAKASGIREVRPLLPENLAEMPDRQAAIEQLRRHPMVSGQLLSPDENLMLAVALIDPAYTDQERVAELIGEMDRIAKPWDSANGLEVLVTGNAAIRLAMKTQAMRDQIFINAIGGLLAFLIAYRLFRSLRVSLLVSFGPLVGVLWTLGFMGLTGQPVNVINQMIPPLIMVIGFTDAVHIMFAVQRLRRQGSHPDAASLAAIREVGFACALTSVSTAIGFAALTVSKAQVIQGLGVYAGVGALLTFIAVITSIPLLASYLEDAPVLRVHGVDNGVIESGFFRWIVDGVIRHPVPVLWGGAALTLAALVSSLYLDTDFRFRENLPRHHEVSRAMALSDRYLGGIQPLNITVSWSGGTGLPDSRVLEVIDELKSRLAGQLGIANTLSIVDFLRLLPGRSDDLSERLPRLIYLPERLVEGLLNESARMANILCRLPDSGARQHLQLFSNLEGLLLEMQQSYPQYVFQLNGIQVAAARGSTNMIRDLGLSLTGAVCLIFIMMAVVLRSLRLGIVSILPNILPLAAVSAALVWSGQSLQYATIMVFTICLGVIVDDTIHLLVRFRREHALRADIPEALRVTLASVGPVLVTTTLILLCGFGAMMLSETEVIVRMGMLSCLALIMALLADLILLPAIIAVSDSRGRAS
ncbi:MAG: MMPL family transporter [Candidatus Thiodiazotropha sp.]